MYILLTPGNKRTAGQSCDQTLTRMNKALAKNCNAKLNESVGATAQDWKGGIPVRVLRSSKLANHSKYAPADGNRYTKFIHFTQIHKLYLLQ